MGFCGLVSLALFQAHPWGISVRPVLTSCRNQAEVYQGIS